MKVRTLSLVCFSLLVVWFASSVRAQTDPAATMVSSLTATQGQTITYTVVITNRASNALTGVVFSDPLDPNTTFVDGSLNSSPLALPESFSVLGNVQLTVGAPGLLENDFDADGVGPALTITAATTTSANGGNVTIHTNGSFTYNPPRGFEGTDTFTYQLNDGEGFTDIGTVSMTVTGMIWFVNAAAPAGGDGRLTTPFNTLAALAAINNGAGNNPAAGDSIFLYSGSYAGPLTLLNNQKLIGQGAGASITAITGLTPPSGSLPLPAAGGARPLITGNTGGIALGAGNLVRGVSFNNNGGTSLGGPSVGALAITEVAVTNTTGTAVNLAGGALNVTLGTVSVNGAVNGIRLANCTGSFTVNGDGSFAQNGTGGTIQNTTGNGIHLDNVAGISLSRMNVTASRANGLFGQNVNGLVIDWCSFSNNGDATDESGIRLGDPLGANGLVGTVSGGGSSTRIANTLVRSSAEMNVAIYNSSGTLGLLEVLNVVSKDTRLSPLGADGFYFETRATANASLLFRSCSFSNNFTQGIQASALGQSALNVTVENCGFTNNNEGVVLANAADADLTFDINGNRFFNNLAINASGSAIAAVNATTVTPSAIYSGRIRNNTIIGGGIDNHLVTVLLAGAGNNTLHVADNNINATDAQFSGVFIQAGETGSGNLNANVTVTGNTVIVGPLGSHGIVVQSRITSTLCAEIAGNASVTGGIGLFGINVRQRDTSTFRLPGFAGPFNSTAAVIAFLQAKNPSSTIGATVATAYSGGAACVVPLAPQSFPFQSEFPPDLEISSAAPDPNPHSPALASPMSLSSSTVMLNVGILPPAKSLTITFRARIANPMPSGVYFISNQGTITADGGISVLTDDPVTAASLDPTITQVLVPPVAVTQLASSVTANGATLNGSIHPSGSPAHYYFQYGATTSYGNTTATNTLPTGHAEVPVSAPVAGLEAGVTYHFRLVAANDIGLDAGDDLTFTTTLGIVQEPTNTVACVGGSATFSASAGSTSVNYQWQRRAAGSDDFQDISGATTADYVTPALTAEDDGSAYRVVISTSATNLTSAAGFLSVIAIDTPTIMYDFDSGLPAETAVYGNAFVDAGTGVLELNANAPGQTGAFLTTDLAPGEPVRGFTATFVARLEAGSFPPADGFSFNWATDLPNDIYAVAEEGEGSGLRVTFDTWDNGFAEAPAIDIWWGATLVAHRPVSIPFLVRGDFVDVQIRLSPEGLLDLTYACEPIFARLPVSGFVPQTGARFGLGSRTGAAWGTHGIDDLALELYFDPVDNPARITSITLEPPDTIRIEGTGAPGQNYALEVSNDLVDWAWHAAVLTDGDGLWQHTESIAGAPSYRFYRLKGAPQFPPGLVTWYKFDTDLNDSFGPNHALEDEGVSLEPGQRGQALRFDPRGGNVTIKAEAIPVPWTIGFWVNRQDSADPAAALLSDSRTSIRLEQFPDTRQVGFTQYKDADYAFNYSAPVGEWVHLVLVATERGTELHVNGVMEEIHPATIDLPLETLSRPDVDRLNADLDEVTIFNRALNRSEVSQLYNSSRGP